MKAIGYQDAGTVAVKDALGTFELETPTPGARDLLVEVRGISVNPVDVKVRERRQPEDGPGILGFDAAGVVKEVGAEVTMFRPGDEVFYAGDITRPGTNAEFQLVDERIVGRKPSSLGFAEAASLPLTSITAWEMLFDSFALREGEGEGESLLVIGGAGGVGSILIQLAKALTKLTVVATASRPETTEWVNEMGADHVINHRGSLVEQLNELGLVPRYVSALTATDQHFPAILELIKPRGHVAIIDDPETLDIKAGKTKALSFSWEFMFTRSMFATDDMAQQHKLLNRVSAMVDEGRLRSTMTRHLGTLSPVSLQEAHELQESGRAIGKSVLDGLL